MFPGPVLAALRADPRRVAIETAARAVTCGELLTMIGRIVGGLREAGVKAGTRVGMVMPLSPETYAAHLAAHSLGCMVAPARPGWSRAQVSAAMREHDVVITDSALDIPALSLQDLLEHGTVEEVSARARPDDLARLIYTSGSTGLPKGCVHTYRAISLAYQPEEWPPVLARLLTHFGRGLIHHNLASPVHFTYLGRCLVTGGTAIMRDDIPAAEAVEKHRATALALQPVKLDQLVRADADLSSLRAVILGGSPAGPQLLRAAAERLGPIVWQGYGQGEAGIIAMLTPEDIAAGHVTSVGRPMPSVDMVIDDGEICVRSPHMMAGYWNDPEQTREVLQDGWLRTRDLGHLDAEGLLHLTGRSRDVIMVNAEVCHAGAIERLLATHPAVSQAYVVGAPDTRTGEAIHAFVVPAEGATVVPQTLLNLVREHLSANNVPQTINIVNEVPLNGSGKPDKRALLG